MINKLNKTKITPCIEIDKTLSAPHESIPEKNELLDFTDLDDSARSIDLIKIKIKRPSHLLPPEDVICKREAFRSGTKFGSGSIPCYKFTRKIKEVFHALPITKSPKLVDALDAARNEARVISEHITKLTDQFDCAMSDNTLSPEIKKEAALMSLFFLERNICKLKPIVTNMKIYTGLLNGNAVLGMHGNIQSRKKPLEPLSIRLEKKDIYKSLECRLLERVADDHSKLESAILRLSELGLSKEYFLSWKRDNGQQIELLLNKLRGAGSVAGAFIQGSIASAINYGLSIAFMNPVLFAAGTYFLVSAVVRMGVMGARTHFQNNLIREAYRQSAEGIACELRVTQTMQSNLDCLGNIENIDKLHSAIDALAQQVFNISAALWATSMFTATAANGVTKPVAPTGLVVFNALNMMPVDDPRNLNHSS